MSTGTFVNGVIEIARLAAGGFTSDEIATTRINICNQCPEYVSEYIGGEWNPATGQYGVWTEKNTCNHCGCTMPWKVKFAVADCPLGKW